MHFCSIYLFVALLFLVAFHFISSLFFFHFFSKTENIKNILFFFFFDLFLMNVSSFLYIFGTNVYETNECFVDHFKQNNNQPIRKEQC